MNARENYIRAAQFDCPEWIPSLVHIYSSTWKKHRERMDDLVLRYPHLFDKGGEVRGTDEMPWRTEEFSPAYRAGEYYTDPWGCVWYNVSGGLKGQVVKSPLTDWNALSSYRIPDPLIWGDFGPIGDWEEIQAKSEKRRREGRVTVGDVGYFYHRLTFLRGFKNLMMDFMTGPPQLTKLADMMVENKLRLIDKWLEINVDVIAFVDDLGTQTSLQMSPATFRRYLKPAYDRMMNSCREASRIIYLHSDGHIVELTDDFVDLGINIINPQFRANGLNSLVQKCKGRICVDLDLDRQLFPFATPKRLKNHVKEAVARLGAKEGGLMLFASCSPDVPLANIEAICQSLDEYRFFHS